LVPRDERLRLERLRDDDDAEVRLGAGRHVVHSALVEHLEVLGRERLDELGADPFGAVAHGSPRLAHRPPSPPLWATGSRGPGGLLHLRRARGRSARTRQLRHKPFEVSKMNTKAIMGSCMFLATWLAAACSAPTSDTTGTDDSAATVSPDCH